MATCKECLHYDACVCTIKASFPNIQEKEIEQVGIRENNCKNFKSAADVVPVVRCKNCTEWDEKEQECSHWYGFRENDFCSHGKEKEDGNV